MAVQLHEMEQAESEAVAAGSQLEVTLAERSQVLANAETLLFTLRTEGQ